MLFAVFLAYFADKKNTKFNTKASIDSWTVN